METTTALAVLAAYAGVFAILGIIGRAIGRPRGHAGVGTLLGIFFGPLGWVVTAFLPRTVGAEREWRKRIG